MFVVSRPSALSQCLRGCIRVRSIQRNCKRRGRIVGTRVGSIRGTRPSSAVAHSSVTCHSGVGFVALGRVIVRGRAERRDEGKGF